MFSNCEQFKNSGCVLRASLGLKEARNISEFTFRGTVTHKHLSSVMNAVIQLVTRLKFVCSQPVVMYWSSIGSNGRSASLKVGFMQMFVHSRDATQIRSEIANPVGGVS